MTDINLKTLTPDTSLPTTGFLFGADSQASTNPSVYSTQTVATTLLGSTSLTGDTLTANAPVLDLSQTWNSVGTTFTGVRFNAAGSSSTNSASASYLMDLQVGGTTQFSVRKDGQVNILQDIYGGRFIWITNPAGYFTINGDAIFSRKAAANWRFGAADAASPVAQTLSVQSIVGGLSGTPNLSATAYPFTITGAQGTGNAVGGSIIFQVAPAGSSGFAQNTLQTAMTIAGTKNITVTGSFTATASPLIAGTYLQALENNTFFYAGASADLALARDGAGIFAQRNGVNAQTFRVYNTYSDGSNYERGVFDWTTTANTLTIAAQNAGTGTARNMVISTASGNNLQLNNGYIYVQLLNYNFTLGNSLTLRWNSSTAINPPSDGNLTLQNNAQNSFGLLQLGGTTSSFPALKRSTTSLQARLADDSAFTNIQGKLTTDNAYTAGAVVQTGYVTIYDSTGTAYKVLVGT